MRKILVNNQIIDIDPEEVIEFTLRSNLLEFEDLQGSFTSTFKLPYAKSARNQIVFSFTGNPRRKNRGIVSLPFKFYWKGSLKYSGIIEAKQCAEFLECTATVENGALNEMAKDLYCDELELGTIAIEYKAFYNPSSDAYCFPLLINDRDYSRSRFANLWHPTTNNYTQIDPNDGTVLVPVVPMLYVKSAIKLIFGHFGYLLNDTFFAGGEYENTVLLSMYDINYHESSYVTPPSFYANRCFPHISVADFLKGISNFFNIIFNFNSNSYVDIISRADIISAQINNTTTSRFNLNLERSQKAFGYEADTSDAKYAEGQWLDIKSLKREIQPANKVLTDGIVDSTIEVDAVIYFESMYGDYYEKKLHTDNISAVWSKMSRHSAQIIQNDFDVAILSKLTPVGFFTEGSLNLSSQTTQIPYAGRIYEPVNFTAFRVGFSVDQFAQQYLFNRNGDGTEITNYDETDTATNLWNVGWNKNNAYQKLWAKFLNWLNNDAETFDSTIEADSTEYFINTLRFDQKYQNQRGERFILTEVSLGFSATEVSKPKIKGVTHR